jgi:phosphate transport system ATP-binding protein
MDVKIRTEQLRVFFGKEEVLKGVDLEVCRNQITGIMGPAGSGKSTLISVVNRMIDFEDGFKVEGRVFIDGKDILNGGIDEVDLRRRVGTVFAVPIPLPRSIYDNIAYGPRLKGVRNKEDLDGIVKKSLQDAFLWEEVKDRLQMSAPKLSGGQQQRLCLARTLALRPEIILLDEPCSGLDPISTAKIEEALNVLKNHYTIILVSNNTKQIARITDYSIFLYMGELVEFGSTEKIFTFPSNQKTEDYIQGKFG